jgi:hypothetical protein
LRLPKSENRTRSNDTKISVRDKILLYGARSVLFHGLQGDGVDTLIKASKVTKVTFYRHFPSKACLFSPICTIGMKYGLTGLNPRCVDISMKAKYLLMRYICNALRMVYFARPRLRVY